MNTLKKLKGWCSDFLFSTEGSLSKKIFRGGAWLSFGTASANILGLLKVLIFARLLSPSDFGLMGIAIVCLRWVEAFTESGFRAALIFHRGDILPFIDTVRIVQFVRSLVLILFIISFSDIIAMYVFKSPSASPVIKSISIIMLIRGVQNPAVIIFKKKLDMKVEFKTKLLSSIAGFIVGVSAAFYMRNVWALLLAFISSEAVITVLSYYFYPLMPRLRFSLLQAKILFKYGRSVFLSNLFGFFKENVDSLLVANFCGIQSLGYYQIIRQFCYDPAYQLSCIINATLFPAFSSTSDKNKHKTIFTNSFIWIAAFLLPLACLVSIFSEQIVYLCLGPKWLLISTSLSFFVFAAILLILNSVLTACLAGIGKPELPALAYGVNFFCISMFFLPVLFKAQELGMVIAVTVSTMAAFLVLVIFCLHHLHLQFIEFIKKNLPPIIFSLSLLATAFFFKDGIKIQELVLLSIITIIYLIYILKQGLRAKKHIA